MATAYGSSFYRGQKAGSLNSAKILVPWIVQITQPNRVIDVGCGVGTWASEYIKAGVTDVIGLDGDYVDRNELLIPAERFKAVKLDQPPQAGDFGKFDVVNCLEVAEHLPESASEAFVTFLTGLGEIIVFGAAVPDQGGTHHINEQWQSYWLERFASSGFRAIDAIRPRFWGEPVEWWYLQNTIIFTSELAYDRLSALGGNIVDAIHPRNYMRRMAEIRWLRKEMAMMRAQLEQLGAS